MRIEDLKNWTVDQLKEEVVRLADESEAKQNKKINELQAKLDNMRAYNNELKRQVDEKADTPFYDESIEIAKYHRRYESDCITINQLQTALDVLVDRYATLRKIHGVSLYGGEK